MQLNCQALSFQRRFLKTKKKESSESSEEFEDLKDKFVVPGSWTGVAFVCLPITTISVFMCVVAGWMSLVISIAMIAGMPLLKAMETGVKMLIVKIKRKRTRQRRERGEIEQSPRILFYLLLLLKINYL